MPQAGLELWILPGGHDDWPWVVELSGPDAEDLLETPGLAHECRTVQGACICALYWSRRLGLPININAADRAAVVPALTAAATS